MARYYRCMAVGIDEFDRQFDREGAGFLYESLEFADSMTEAEEMLREAPRFRRACRQCNISWQTVPVIVEETTVKDFV